MEKNNLGEEEAGNLPTFIRHGEQQTERRRAGPTAGVMTMEGQPMPLQVPVGSC